jgi:clan AA aspartic protease
VQGGRSLTPTLGNTTGLHRNEGSTNMGHVFAEIELSNPREPDLVPIKAKALAGTGALMLCIPKHFAIQLKLERESVREVSVADGRNKNVPYVGPVRVSFGKRFCYVGALVLGDEVLVSPVPMEDMDLVVSPSRRDVTPGPASPNIPHARVKSQTLQQRAGGDRRRGFPPEERCLCKHSSSF